MTRTLEVLRLYPRHSLAVEGFKEYEERFKTHPGFVFKRSSLTIEGQGIRNRFLAWNGVDQVRGLQLDKVVIHEHLKLSEEELFNLKAQLVMSKVGSPIERM